MTTLSSLWTESADGQLGILMSALSGIAMALAVALDFRDRPGERRGITEQAIIHG